MKHKAPCQRGKNLPVQRQYLDHERGVQGVPLYPGAGDNLRDLGRRWGEDNDRTLLRHLMGITAAMEVWDPLTDTEQGEGTVTVKTSTEAPDMEGQEMPDVPASTSAHSWGPTEDECLADTSSNRANLGGPENPAEAE